MADFDHITRCMDLSDADLAAAKSSRAAAQSLIMRMAQVAEPSAGAAKILLIFAYVAQADWFEGGLRLEMGGDHELTVIDVLSELGAGYSERVFPTFLLKASLEEFRRAIRLQPKFILPLKLKHDRQCKIVLAVRPDERFSSFPPPVIEVSTLEISPPFMSLQAQSVISSRPQDPYFPKAEPTISFGIHSESPTADDRPTLPTRMVPLPPARLARVPPRPSKEPYIPHPGQPVAPTNVDFSQSNKKGLSAKKSGSGK